MLPDGIPLVQILSIEGGVVKLKDLKPGECFVFKESKKYLQETSCILPTCCMKADSEYVLTGNVIDLQFGDVEDVDENLDVSRASFEIMTKQIAEQYPVDSWKIIKKDEDGAYINLPPEDTPVLISVDGIVSIDSLVSAPYSKYLDEFWFDNLGYGHEVLGIGWRLLPEPL